VYGAKAFAVNTVFVANNGQYQESQEWCCQQRTAEVWYDDAEGAEDVENVA
jgi:hypothetical protein